MGMSCCKVGGLIISGRPVYEHVPYDYDKCLHVQELLNTHRLKVAPRKSPQRSRLPTAIPTEIHLDPLVHKGFGLERLFYVVQGLPVTPIT